MPKYEYQATLHACGEDLPWTLPGGWEYAGAYVRQGEGHAVSRHGLGRCGSNFAVIASVRWPSDPKPFLLATWRRPLTAGVSYATSIPGGNDGQGENE